MPKGAKNILILSSWYPTKEHPFLGNFVERNAELLSSDHHITVLHVELANDVSEITLNKTKTGNLTKVTVCYPNAGKIKRRVNRLKAFKLGLNSLKQIDLVIGHVLLPHGWMFLQASRKFNCPLIWVEHGSYFRRDLNRKWSLREKWILKKVSSVATSIVAVSETLKLDMEEHVNGKPIKVIGNHVDDSMFTFKEKSPTEITRFLHISTLDPNTKNPKGIIEACSLLHQQTNAFELTIISDEDYSEWKKMVALKGLENTIKFVGPLSWNKIPPYYHKSDAFVLFSNYESFSIVLAEALCTGTPIISTNVGIASQLHNNSALIVEKNDVSDLKDKMLSLINREMDFNFDEILKQGSKFHTSNILGKWNQIISDHAK